MVTIYDADGNEKTVDSVDAREHLETGRWFDNPPGDREPAESAKRKKGVSK